jgi:hypothetical protein
MGAGSPLYAGEPFTVLCSKSKAMRSNEVLRWFCGSNAALVAFRMNLPFAPLFSPHPSTLIRFGSSPAALSSMRVGVAVVKVKSPCTGDGFARSAKARHSPCAPCALDVFYALPT